MKNSAPKGYDEYMNNKELEMLEGTSKKPKTMSKKTQYPIYFRNADSYFCILNRGEAIYASTYYHLTQIQHLFSNRDTFIHEIFRDKGGECIEINKSEFLKAYKEARKILQEEIKKPK